ncbi:hypothetical protein BpJC7_10920 [Weizmannia acidilactici]|uniref:Uncharacterized protein n=1 Tax=Weizmannia acidilactici TaxID=2607726 RepID=A0A5J4JEG1_9BACI|nr:hypothetical protein [Weizmannia acidilactici]GER67566.1 hypothetical protein BpJC4_20370 [Weizmannia acidilactici]GER69789.1 hypothetical protein BpJC7_10920 [Weizmannia acidilactici]GER73653.1 hypothetical protein BpPP18_17200 [Weizmannia acidilactici]
MKEILEQIKEKLENAYNNPESADLEECIRQLQEARQQYGDKGTMIQDAITALEQAKNSLPEHRHVGTESSASAFGQAYNALEHAIESFSGTTNNDPF